MVRIVLTVEDNGTLSIQGQMNGGDVPRDICFGVVTAAWVEVLAWKIAHSASGLIVPHN